jgi:speckle-type POZ protein
MGTASVVSAAAAAAATTTTTVTVTSTVSTGSHQFKINGYTQTKLLGGGRRIKSHHFRAGGHTWRVLFYPNVGNAASFDLKLSGRGKHWPDRVIARFALVRRDGSEPVSFIRNFDPMDFVGRAAEKLMVMGREELDKYVVANGDDSLTVQCDVSVIRVSVVKERPPARPSRIKTAWSGLTRRLRAHHVLGFRCLSAQPLLS